MYHTHTYIPFIMLLKTLLNLMEPLRTRRQLADMFRTTSSTVLNYYLKLVSVYHLETAKGTCS